MKRRHDHSRRPAHVAACAAGLWLGSLCFSHTGLAITWDARQFAMGGAQTPGGRDLTGLNVAYYAMPQRDFGRGLVVPVPLGLVDLALDFPSFDPEDPDFNTMRLANLALNPPFFLELRDPQPLDGDISIFVARNQFSVQFEEAAQLLPQRPFEVSTVMSTPLFGLEGLGLQAYVAPLVYARGEVVLDDALHGVLSRGEPLLSNSSYMADARGEAAGGTTLNVGYTMPVYRDARGNGLYAGAMAKYVLGFAMGSADSRFALTTNDTIFGGSTPMDLDFESMTRHANSIGNGVGFDAGVGYRQGPVDVGIGLRDVGTRIMWSRTTVHHSHLDDASNTVLVETVESGVSYTQKIPMQTTVNIGWTQQYLSVVADLTVTEIATLLHLGAEQRLGPMALRGGVLTDEHARVQYAWGGGFGLGPMWLDVGLQTHSHTFTGERGLLLGTSIAFR